MIIIGPKSTVKTVGIRKKATFIIQTRNADLNQIAFSLTKNQNRLFSVKDLGKGKGELSFKGTKKPGTYEATVKVSDGNSFVLYRARVKVVCVGSGGNCKSNRCCPGLKCKKEQKILRKGKKKTFFKCRN